MNKCKHEHTSFLDGVGGVGIYACDICAEVILSVVHCGSRIVMGKPELIQLCAENARLKQQLEAELTAYYLLREECDSFIAKFAAAEKIFNHFGGLSELSKWENAGGETAANVVQEYLEL